MSATDTEYASLAAQYGPGLSLMDMRMKMYGGPTSPAKSVEDLAAEYYAANGGSANNSRSDNEYKYWPGDNSMSDDKNTAGGVITTVRTNLATDPRAVDTATDGWRSDRWFGGGASGTYTYTTGISGPFNITTGRKKAWTVAPGSNAATGFAISGTPTDFIPVTPGDTLTVSAYMKVTSTSGYKPLQMRIALFDRVTIASAVSKGADLEGPRINSNGSWQRVSVTAKIPAGVLAIMIHPDVWGGAGDTDLPWAVGDTVEATGLLMEKSPNLGTYFDGATPDIIAMDYAWAGAANDSISTATPKSVPAALVTIDQLVGTTPFYIGHRGSGEVWPEHTQVAYQGAFDGGAKALEWSVQRGIEGTWFHLHDAGATGLNGVTDRTGDPKLLTDAQIATTHITVPKLGNYWSVNPPLMAKFTDMMNLFYNKVVLFLEPKDYSTPAVDELLSLLSAYPGYKNSIIWKQHVNGAYGLAQARAQGMKTWAYIDYPLNPTQLTDALARGDYIGIPKFDGAAGFENGLTPAEVDTVISAAGSKKVLAWPPLRRNIIAGLVAQGVDGFVSSTVPYTNDNLPDRVSDQFGSGKWAPGDLGFDSTRTANISAFATAHFNTTGTNPSLMLGSFCPIQADSYSIEFEFKYDVLPAATLHSGIAFGKVDDKRFQFQAANETGGYHVILRQNGQLQLFKHDAGVTSGTQLGATQATTALNTTDWAKVVVTVSPSTITAQRLDGTPSAIITSNDTTYRGKYIHLSRNHVSSSLEYVHFRNVKVNSFLNGPAPVHSFWSGSQVLADNASVSSWPSSSGGSLTNTGGAVQPVYKKNDPAFNNQPSLIFDGTDDYLQADITDIPPTYYLVGVLRLAASSANLRIAVGTGSGAPGGMGSRATPENNWFVWAGNTWDPGASFKADTSPHLLVSMVEPTGGSGIIQIDNNVSSTGSTLPGAATFFKVGAGGLNAATTSFWHGSIAYAAVFTSDPRVDPKWPAILDFARSCGVAV